MKDNLKKFLTNKDDIIKTACFAFIIGFLLMGASTTISSNIGAKVVNVLSSISIFVSIICILLIGFYEEIFNKKKINKKIISRFIIAFLCLLAGVIIILISSNMVFNIKGLDDALVWLVAVAMLSVSILIISKQYLIDKVYWEEKPIMAYVILILCMLYALAFAIIIKPDLVFKILFTIHTLASLIVFVNTVFRYGIKAKNIWQITFFVLSVICLMALMIYSLYMWFWNINNSNLFNSIMGVFAGLLGGIITLGGVAWTIKRQDDARKAMEIEKAKPYLKIIKDNGIYKNLRIKLYKIISKDEALEEHNQKIKYFMQFNKFLIKVVKNADCVLCGAIINNFYIEFEKNKYVEKGDIYEIDLMPTCESVIDYKNIEDLYIVAKDILGNYYKYKILYEVDDRIVTNKENIFIEYRFEELELPKFVSKEELEKIEYKHNLTENLLMNM